jgi:hypothetical protein
VQRATIAWMWFIIFLGTTAHGEPDGHALAANEF